MTLPTGFTPNPDLDLVLEREVDVPPERVWAAWTQPEQLKQWFAPKPFTTPRCELDVRPGGIFHVVMSTPDGEEMDPGPGCILEAVENERLVWTGSLGPNFRPNASAGGPAFTAIISMTPTASGTRYTAVAMHADTDGRTQHADMGFMEGWGAALDQLVELVKSA